MKIRIQMCNIYIRDMARNRGWDNQNWLLKIKSLAIVLARYQMKLWKILRGRYTYLRQVELVLTTKCSLRCRDCANLMQYYSNPYDVETKDVITALENMVKYFDEINTVVLVGGEPFLYKNISEIILSIIDFPQIKHINIFTNGTIIPKEKDIYALAKDKVKIIISDYGEISRNKYDLMDFCKNQGINFYLKNKDLFWGFVGDMEPRKRTSEELRKQFRKCNNYCRSILNGKLFYCPRAAHGDDLGYVKADDECVNLLDDNVSKDEIMNVVYSTHYFSACDFCNYGTSEMISITPGVQIQNSGKKDIFTK